MTRRQHRQSRTDRSSWSRRLIVGLALVVLPELGGNTIAQAFSTTLVGVWLQAHLAVVGGSLLAAVVVVWAVLFTMERLGIGPPIRVKATSIGALREPPDEKSPEWHRFPARIHGRDREIDLAVAALRYRRLVAVVGSRDVGTSSVANHAVARLLAEDVLGVPATVACVDLRGLSSTEPPGARSVAGRVLSTFKLDEPADDTQPVLADAAARLIAVLRQQAIVLLLDNVFHADQVSWLTEAWPVTGRLPVLVIAGDLPVASAVKIDSRVDVDPLHLSAMRAILSDELGEKWPRRVAGTMRGLGRDLRGDRSDRVDELLRTFRGRPTAVREIARLLRRADGRPWSLDELIDHTDGHTGNQPLVALWQVVLPGLMERTLSGRATDLMRALAVLPVTGVGSAALHAMLPPPRPAYQDAVAELCQANVVRESPTGRFRLPEEVRLAIQGIEPQPVTSTVWDAVAGLVRYYATQASGCTATLRSGTDALATEWLHQEEPLLRALLTDWRPDALPPVSLVDDLAVIADALDVWYLREQQSDGLVRASRGLAKLAERAGRDELVRLAELRTAAAHRIGTHLDLTERAMDAAKPDERTARHPAGSALRARWHNERALIEFARAAAVRDDRPAVEHLLRAAEHELYEALALVPEADPAGRLCVLVNLAAVALRQDRLPVATAFLAQADLLADVSGDRSGRAQVIELQGVAAIQGHNAPHAVARWQQALALYQKLGEEQGEARCLCHLGTVAVVRPDIAGLLDTGHLGQLGKDGAAAVARDYLLRSKGLLAGQPDPGLADYYLRIAEGRRSG